MIIVSLTDCPPGVRGDLSRWFCEINTGVYVGNVSARVRDALWERICEKIRNGRATMVYTARNEQGFCFRVHNTTWEPVDFDGITLMRRPSPRSLQSKAQTQPGGLSNYEKQRLLRKQEAVRSGNTPLTDYCVIDLETTGLSADNDQIVELGAVRVSSGNICDRFSRLIRIDRPLPASVAELTGLSDEMLESGGEPLETALPLFLEFIAAVPIVGYHVSFDMAFLREACRRFGLQLPRVRIIDTLELARRKVFGLPSLKLERLVEYYHLDALPLHRALNDCLLTQQVYAKLTEPN